MKKYLLLGAVLLSGCVSTDLLYVDENGKQVYQTICNWNDKTIGDCFKAAGKMCPRGFNIIERYEGSKMSGSTTMADLDSTTTSSASASGGFYGNMFQAFGNAVSNTAASLNSSTLSNTIWERYIIYTCK